MSQFWPDKEVPATIPRFLGDTSQTSQLQFCNWGEDTLLAQILGIAWLRILESLYLCSRQFQTKFPGVIQNTHTTCNPQRLTLTLISNMMEHSSVNLFLCSSGQIILQSASYFQYPSASAFFTHRLTPILALLLGTTNPRCRVSLRLT